MNVRGLTWFFQDFANFVAQAAQSDWTASRTDADSEELRSWWPYFVKLMRISQQHYEFQHAQSGTPTDASDMSSGSLSPRRSWRAEQVFESNERLAPIRGSVSLDSPTEPASSSLSCASSPNLPKELQLPTLGGSLYSSASCSSVDEAARALLRFSIPNAQ